MEQKLQQFIMATAKLAHLTAVTGTTEEQSNNSWSSAVQCSSFRLKDKQIPLSKQQEQIKRLLKVLEINVAFY